MKDWEKEFAKWEKEAKAHIKDSKKEPDYTFAAGRIGATASPQVANQIGELNSRLNQGLKAVELGTMNQRLLDQVPEEHFREARRLGKLTGSEASLHAPIQDLDLAGFSQQGWDPTERKRKVAQLGAVVKKAHLLDPEGNTPITIHAGTFPAQKWQKDWKDSVWKDEKGKPVEDKKSEMMLINPHSGEVRPTRYKEKLRFGEEKPEAWTPERQMNNMNITSWHQEQFQLSQWKKAMDEKDAMTQAKLNQFNYNDLVINKQKGILTQDEKTKLEIVEEEIKDNINFKKELYQNMSSAVEDMYERLEKYHYTEGDYGKDWENYNTVEYPEYKKRFKEGEKEIITKSQEIRELQDKISQAKKSGDEERFIDLRQKTDEKIRDINNIYEKQTDILRQAAQEMPAPKLWRPVDEFAKEETAKSLAEAAVNSYKEYGKNSPMLLLENVYPEFALSRADTLKGTIEEAQKNFVNLATKDKKEGGLGLSKNAAEEHAKKVIGVTWDVGHIYMLRKSGYTDEDIEKEAKKIAPHVKHLHLTDNFGFEDSHLPPGLGEVNIKEQLKAIEKVQAGLGNKEDFEKVRGIVEAGEFVANYKEAPHVYALEHLGSPMYSEAAAPYWQQSLDTFGNYFGGYGELMPQKYFDLYGAPGFSQLPATLGGSGQGGGERGRFASSSGQGSLTDEEG